MTAASKRHQFWPRPGLMIAAGVSGPLLLGGTILTLTLRQQASLRSLRWDPLRAPTVDWPSGLALSPDGLWMIGTFFTSGALLSVCAAGLHHRESWRALALPTLITVLLAAPAFVLKGPAFYGFLALILAWFLLIAGRLWQLTRTSDC